MAQSANSSSPAAVASAVDRWLAALNAMVAGNPEPFAAVFSHADDVLYLSGEGTYRVGWNDTWADWQEQARKSLGGQVEAHDVRIIVGGELATATLVAHATVRMPDGGKRELRVRQTQVFRQEGGAWKMIVHHADNLPVWNAIVNR